MCVRYWLRMNCLFYPDSQHLFLFSILCLEWKEISIYKTIGKIIPLFSKIFWFGAFSNLLKKPLEYFIKVFLNIFFTAFSLLTYPKPNSYIALEIRNFSIRKVQQFWFLKNYETFPTLHPAQVLSLLFIQHTHTHTHPTYIHTVTYIHALIVLNTVEAYKVRDCILAGSRR